MSKHNTRLTINTARFTLPGYDEPFEPNPTMEPEARGYRRIEGEQEHRVFWGETHGPIPEGHVIHHIDGNPSNNSIDNLACMSAGNHMRLHHATRRALLENITEERPERVRTARGDYDGMAALLRAISREH